MTSGRTDEIIPRDPPRFLGANGLAAIAAGAIATAAVGALRSLDSDDLGEPLLAPTVFVGAALGMALLLRWQSPDARPRRLYTGPLVMGAVAGPLSMMFLYVAAHLRDGHDRSLLTGAIASGFWLGLVGGPFLALPLTPIAVGARDWARGAFDRALFIASLIVLGAGTLLTIVHTLRGGVTWRESYVLLAFAIAGLFFYAARTWRPRYVQVAPEAGPFRAPSKVPSEEPAPARTSKPRPRLALGLGLVVLALLPLAWRTRANVAEHRPSYHARGKAVRVPTLDGSAKNLQVTAGARCAQRADDMLVCWGNEAGLLLGERWQAARTPTPRAGLGPIYTYAIWGSRLCVLEKRGGRVSCFDGSNSKLAGPEHAIDLLLDEDMLYVVTERGEVWEQNFASVSYGATPTRVENLPPVKQLAASSGGRACAITHPDAHAAGSGSNVSCWNAYQHAQRIDLPGPAEKLHMGRLATHARLRTSDGGHTWWTWPSREVIANGEPEEVLNTSDVKDYFTDDVACRLHEDNGVRCGPAGSDLDERVLRPGPPTELVAYSTSSCAKRPDGIWCWQGYPFEIHGP